MRTSRAGVVCCGVLALAACTQDDPALQCEPPPGAASSILRPSEQPLAELAQVEPCFAGYYCEDRHLVVLVAAGADAEPVVSRISRSTIEGCGGAGVRVRDARYSFLRLQRWRDAIWASFLDLPEATSLGIGYSGNHVMLGLRERPTAAFGRIDPLTRLLRAHDLPRDAYTISIEEPVEEH